MTHRTVDLDGLTIEVFNTGIAAHKWLKRNKGDCIVIVRNAFYFQRKEGGEMTVRLNATDNPQNRHLLAAANSVADEVERLLQKEAA